MFLNFGLGLLLSVAALSSNKPGESILKNPAFRLSLGYDIIVFLGLALVGWVVAPDWMWSYFIDSKDAPWGMVLFALCFYPLMFCLGYLAAPELEKLKKRLALRALLVDLILMLIFMILLRDRLGQVGDFTEYASGRAYPLISLVPFELHLVG